MIHSKYIIVRQYIESKHIHKQASKAIQTLRGLSKKDDLSVGFAFTRDPQGTAEGAVLGTYEYTKTKGPEHQNGKMNLDLMNAVTEDARELWRRGVVTAQGDILSIY